MAYSPRRKTFDIATFRKPKRWKNFDVIESVEGVDTETFANGYAFLMCVSDGRVFRFRQQEDVIAALTLDGHYALYNLDYDATAILKWLGRDLCKKLYEHADISWRGLEIRYIPHKILRVRDGMRWTHFYDIAQFCQVGGRRIPLSQAAKWVKMEKLKPNVPMPFEEEHFDDKGVEEYCMQDSRIAGALGNHVIALYNKHDIPVGTLMSPATIAERFIMDAFGAKVADISSWPEGAVKYTVDAYMPPWRDCYRAGFFPEMHNYDINACFPSTVRRLPRMDGGYWQYHEGAPLRTGVTLAYIKCELHVPENHFCPWIAVKRAPGRYYNPAGEFTKVLTQRGYQYARELGWVKRVIDGRYFQRTHFEMPFINTTDYLLAQAGKYERGALERSLMKATVNASTGKFRQMGASGTSRLANPAYSAEIMTDARIAIHKIAREHPEKLIGVHTDCIYSTAPIELNGQGGKDPGQWALRGIQPFLMVNAGVFQHGKDYLVWACQQDGGQRVYRTPETHVMRPVSFRQAMQTNQFEQMGRWIIPKPAGFDISKQGMGREWPKHPRCGRDLLEKVYESQPWVHPVLGDMTVFDDVEQEGVSL